MYYKTPITTNIETFQSLGIWFVISMVIAIMGGLVVYFCFLTKENEEKLKGKAKFLYDFLAFKKLFAETLLKIAYIVTAIFITLFSVGMIGENFVGFLIVILFGNIAARIAYEFALAILLICKNTTEINGKLKKDSVIKAKEIKKEETKESK